ncbi:superoxide dismutase family protein [Maritimibacter sp. DP1N21-5]|uniref:superoxide dismutase family protein n=1 Tax=Maritimibacter sp. DP1N21-5 TaxID=2836867 RepID=UPI001C4657CD|nr:superoxide dismutase family protein [Maritimibacter sp. DP1N21-5]MBV7410080.1 superoxide dismutase family protein [Maritimibacter sp. DP1N21-5]
MKFPAMAACALAGTLTLPALPLVAAEANAEITDRDGKALGAVNLRDTPSGIVVATLTLLGLPEGIHAVHLHETGDCQSDDFSSAGGHVAGDRDHGVLVEGGPHPGDMPNLTIKENGIGEVEVFLTQLDIEEHILDDDGAAFVVHEGIDDYESQPSGDAGDRIACGTFSQRD